MRGLTMAAGVSVVLGGFFMWFAVFGTRHVSGLIQPRDTFVSDLVGLFLPSKFQATNTHAIAKHAGELSGHGGEFSTYLGIPFVILLAVVFWLGRRRRTMQVAAIMFVAALLLSFGDSLHVNGDKLPVPMPWALFSHLPLLENILPSRFILFAWLAAGVMLALFVEHLTRSRSRRSQLLAAGALAVTVASLWPVLHPPSTDVTAPRFFTTSAVDQIPEGATAIVAPTHADSIVTMRWQLKSDFRFLMPQGPVFTPDGWGNPNVYLFTVINVVEGDLHRSPFYSP